MNLIDLSTMTPLSLDELSSRNPLVSFPAQPTVEDLAPFGVAPLTYTPSPISDYGTYTQSGYVQNADGTYSTQWTLSALPLEEAQAVLLAKVAAYRANIAYQNVAYNNVHVPVDSQVITILSVVQNGTATIDFKGVDGWLSITPSDATALIAQIQTQVQAAFTNEKKHHDAIMALTTTDEVAAYDYTTGW